MKYKDFRKFIQNIDNDQIEEYVSNEANNYEIYGRRNKKFVRFSGELFSDLINELRNNPECSYSTYLNNVIKEGYNPEYISVIVKDENPDIIHNDSFKIGHLREKIASKVLNFFGVPTTYDTLVDIEGIIKCCSVDFNRQDEDFYIADELKPFCTQIGGFGELIKSLDSKFKTFVKEREMSGTGNNMETDFVADYVYSYLVRKFVLLDRDFGFHNVGIVHNTKQNTLTLAPNFDYEYCFLHMDLANNSLFRKLRTEDLKYIQKYHSSIYRRFLNKYTKFVDEKKYVDIINKTIGQGKKSQRFCSAYGNYLDSMGKLFTKDNITM